MSDSGGPTPLRSWIADAFGDRTMLAAILVLAVSTLLALLAYLPGLGGPLLLDDLPQLGGLIDESAADPALLFNNYLVSGSGPLGRPVSMTTFILDAISHGPDTWWWKYQNLLIHLVSGLLVAWFAAILAKTVAGREGSDSWLFGAVAGALWLLHPLQVSTVLYTVQRMTELSTLFVLAGLVCYARGRQVLAISRWRGWLLIALGFGVFYPLAALSKENALLFPLYCSLLELLVFRFEGAGRAPRHLRVLHGVLFSGYLLAAVVLLFKFSSLVLDGYEVRDFTLVERVMTQFRVVTTYLIQILLPAQGRMAFFHDDVAVSTGLLSPATTLASLLILGGLLFAAIRLRSRLPLFAFGTLLFFASHLLESTIFPLELMFEHRNYLGIAGIMIAVLSAAPLLLKARRGRIALGMVAIAGLSLVTWQRAQTWSSPSEMYIYMYIAHPESPRLNLIFSNIHANGSNFDQAREALNRVGDGIGPALHGLFFDCLEHGRIERNAMSTVLAVRSGIVDAHATSSMGSLTGAVIDGACVAPESGMRQLFDHVEGLRPRSATDRRALQLTKARYLESTGDIDAAVTVLVDAAAIAGDDALPLYRAARTLAAAGRPGDAELLLVRAYEMEREIRMQRVPMAEAAYSDIATAFLLSGQVDRAVAVYRDAMAEKPGYAMPYIRLAELMIAVGRSSEASAVLASLRGNPPPDLDRFDYELIRLNTALEANQPGSATSVASEHR
jgi:tetratricopeptide (TPR) repeat protein